MKRRRSIRISIIFSMFVVFLLAAHMTVTAAVPGIDEISHKGKGRIKVEFHGKVRYKHVKVTVKDNDGKKYKVKSIKKDNDGIRFTIVKYKVGKTYKITISGIKKKGAGKYGKVSGRCTITPIVKGRTLLSNSDAKSIAAGYVTLAGQYVSSGYYSDGNWIFTVYDEDGNESGITMWIGDEIGDLAYYEYRPAGWSHAFILDDKNGVLSYGKKHTLISLIMSELVGD